MSEVKPDTTHPLIERYKHRRAVADDISLFLCEFLTEHGTDLSPATEAQLWQSYGLLMGLARR